MKKPPTQTHSIGDPLSRYDLLHLKGGQPQDDDDDKSWWDWLRDIFRPVDPEDVDAPGKQRQG